MPHARQRHLADIFFKRLRLFPVLGIIGPRQVGKSTFLRDQVSKAIKASYVSLDAKGERDRATKSPSLFLDSFTDPLCIDEVQKTPDLFDAIKLSVDNLRRPGRFIITGSTQFSNKVGIRESLTGRIGIFHMHPFTLAESVGTKIRTPWLKRQTGAVFSNGEILKRVNHGGMPGICFLRSEDERAFSWDQWLDTTCYRDIHQIKK